MPNGVGFSLARNRRSPKHPSEPRLRGVQPGNGRSGKDSEAFRFRLIPDWETVVVLVLKRSGSTCRSYAGCGKALLVRIALGISLGLTDSFRLNDRFQISDVDLREIDAGVFLSKDDL